MGSQPEPGFQAGRGGCDAECCSRCFFSFSEDKIFGKLFGENDIQVGCYDKSLTILLELSVRRTF